MIQTLNLEKPKVLKAWRDGSNEIKRMLENLHGKDIFQNQKITDRIKTLEDAYIDTGRQKVNFSFLPSDLKEHFENYYNAIVIVEALNEGWTPNWDNGNERKWYPCFIMSPSAFAFYRSSYVRSAAAAGGGSRLKFKSEELTNYAAKTFPEIWKNVQIK